MKLPYISILLAFTGVIVRAISPQAGDRNVERCVEKLIASTFETSHKIATNIDIRTRSHIKIAIDLETTSDAFSTIDTSYAFDLRHTTSDAFLRMVESNRFNVAGTFIVVSNQKRDDFFRKISRYFVYKLFVVDSHLDVYTYWPYARESVDRPEITPKKMCRCDDVEEYAMRESSSSTSKCFIAATLPQLWRNTTLKIYFKHVRPFVRTDYQGMEQHVLKMISRHTGMRIESVLREFEHQGPKDHRTGLYEDDSMNSLLNRTYDVLSGCYYATYETANDFQGSYVWYIDAYHLVSPSATYQTTWKRICNIFRPKTVAVLTMSILAVMIVVKIFYLTSWITLITWFYQCLIEVGAVGMLDKCTFRLIMVSYLLVCILLSTILKNSLFIIFFTETPEVEINHLIQALKLNMTPLMPPVLKRLFETNGKPWERMLLPRVEICKDVMPCLRRVAQRRDAVTAYGSIPIVYARLEHFLDPVTSNYILHIGLPILQSYYQFMFTKGYPAFERLNMVIYHAVASGVVDYERRDVIRKVLLMESRMNVVQSKVIGLEQLSFVFWFWVGGMVVATVVFLIEILGPILRNMYNVL
ncbi:uncharacterized protein LOC132706440 [Cylas formicarius]|uniref:uncharacterized protein LOC132706440 n=1 Tax=Cylas formicarius TaxID=197179 RepID=UPI002958624B|nr:uncharacterized protein LOC132706440 [Cylas formicarius]